MLADVSLPSDHSDRMTRVRLALDGLSVGDAFGQQFFSPHTSVEQLFLRIVIADWKQRLSAV